MIIGLEKHFFCLFESGHFTQVLLYLGRAEQRVHNMRGSRIFSGGGGGGGGLGLTARKQSGHLDNIFFLVLNLFYSLQRGFITEKTIPFQGPRGGPRILRGPLFSRGGPTFSRGVQFL